ncbi:MAG: nicotinamide-nucleotide adenylyltransferase [Candidatus Micrarchaeota archaeon]|nr:nicotinamide-nucleotide adenylyltransferase [Candidatus Micrarchaeota archaeon]
MKRILFIGRFQPFHNGHMYVLKKLLRQYDEVVIVIGSAESEQSWRNPFTAGERVEIISNVLNKEQKLHTVLIPVRDINNHAQWVSHVNRYVPSYEAIYSNNVIVNLLFRKAGVKVLSGYYKRQVYEGQKIRSMIVNSNLEWKKLVPKEVVKYILDNRLVKKIKSFKK